MMHQLQESWLMLWWIKSPQLRERRQSPLAKWRFNYTSTSTTQESVTLGYNTSCYGQEHKGMFSIWLYSCQFDRSFWFNFQQLLQPSHGHGFWFHNYGIEPGALLTCNRNIVRSLCQSTRSCREHKKYLDMIGWAELDPNTPITPAVACKINTGVVNTDA